MAVSIRTATHDDLATLRAFEQGIVAAERPFDPTLAPDPITYHDIPALIDSATAEVLVAVEDGALVGCGFARVEAAKAYEAHRQFALIGMMYVTPEARGLGVAGHILEALETWARMRGVDECRLEVYADNATAMRAYQRAGYVPHMVTMRRVRPA